MANIVETAIAAGSFTTLIEAVRAAGLVKTLSVGGPFTLFAPTDEAFSKLPEGTLEALLKDSEKLKSILTYHVVPGKVTSSDVVNLDSAMTVQGQKLSIKANGEVIVNSARVIEVDVLADNGVIHVIDSVILPEGL